MDEQGNHNLLVGVSFRPQIIITNAKFIGKEFMLVRSKSFIVFSLMDSTFYEQREVVLH